MFGKERRTERRYYFQQPAFVTVLHSSESEIETVTENVSTHGLQLRCEAPVALGSTVRVILRSASCLPLEGVGDVLRVEQPFAGGTFLIAVRCEAPLKISGTNLVSAMQGGEHLA